MSKELAVREFTAKDLDFIKRNIAKDATDQELELFLVRCTKLNLDPLKPGQIFFQKYKNKNTGGFYPATIIVGRDGLRALAARTGKHRGSETGTDRDANGKVIGGWAKVYREGWTHPATTHVSMTEYNRETEIWKDLPETMIQKVAECAALRMAFPDELGGIYSEDERVVSEPRVENNSQLVAPAQIESLTDRPEFETVIDARDYTPGGTNLIDVKTGDVIPKEYVFKTGGSRKGKKITDFAEKRLREFMGEVDKLVAAGKTVSEDVMSDYNATQEFLE